MKKPRGKCAECGAPQKSKGHGYWSKLCSFCHNNLYTQTTPWRKYKGISCEACGFVALNRCQLDVDHIDGDKENNEPSNLRTLCANCHRLKTYLNKENRPRSKRS